MVDFRKINDISQIYPSSILKQFSFGFHKKSIQSKKTIFFIIFNLQRIIYLSGNVFALILIQRLALENIACKEYLIKEYIIIMPWQFVTFSNNGSPEVSHTQGLGKNY